jgi:hypothetical protein
MIGGRPPSPTWNTFTMAGALASSAASEAPDNAGRGDEALEVVRVDAGDAAALAAVSALERELIEYTRGEEELRWLLETREGYFYRRDGRAVGFAFIGRDAAGPMGALEPADESQILLHVESRARALGVDRLTLEVPAVNEVAVRHLLVRGYQIDSWLNLLMASRPFGRFDRFIPFSPPIFL